MKFYITTIFALLCSGCFETEGVVESGDWSITNSGFEANTCQFADLNFSDGDMLNIISVNDSIVRVRLDGDSPFVDCSLHDFGFDCGYTENTVDMSHVGSPTFVTTKTMVTGEFLSEVEGVIVIQKDITCESTNDGCDLVTLNPEADTVVSLPCGATSSFDIVFE